MAKRVRFAPRPVNRNPLHYADCPLRYADGQDLSVVTLAVVSGSFTIEETKLEFLKPSLPIALLAPLLALDFPFAFADEDPMSPMYEMARSEPQVDLSARPLAGKVMRFGYHSFWEVNKDKGVQGTPAEMLHDVFFYEDGDCEWFSLDIFAGEHARQRCGTVEIAENIYQISWLEPDSEQVVIQVINLNTWTINTSFHFNNGKGLALWQGTIRSFGDIPDPPMSLPAR